MKHFTVREWGHLNLREGESTCDAIGTNALPDLYRLCDTAAQRLKLGNNGGERILTSRHNKLRAGQIVGVLASGDVTLEILPKISNLSDATVRDNLVHMLARAYDIPIALGAEARLGVQHRDLLEVLIANFCELLFVAARQGLERRYVLEEGELPVLRGRLDVVRQLTKNAIAPQKLLCRFDELSPNVPLNVIVKAAIEKLKRRARAQANQRRLFELSLLYADVAEVPAHQLPWKQLVLDRTNRRWWQIVDLAQLLLGNQFQNSTGGDANGFSLLFEMNVLFEKYIGREFQGLGTVGEAKLQHRSKYALHDGAARNYFATIPDIVFTPVGSSPWIIDTKWKRLDMGDHTKVADSVVQQDVYQMMAYAQVYQYQNTMLLYPHHESIPFRPGKIAEFLVTGTDRTRLYIGTVDISDLKQVSAQLKDLIRNSVPSEACAA